MPWYAAHAILYVRFKSGRQTRYPVWENILLVNARDATEARRKARRLAKADAGDSRGTFRWGGRAATWVFAGLRKVVTVSHRSANDNLGDGDEITYSEYEALDTTSVTRLAKGQTARIEYVE